LGGRAGQWGGRGTGLTSLIVGWEITLELGIGRRIVEHRRILDLDRWLLQLIVVEVAGRREVGEIVVRDREMVRRADDRLPFGGGLQGGAVPRAEVVAELLAELSFPFV
jgi:hypothetical protein